MSVAWQHEILARLQQRDEQQQQTREFVAEYERAIKVAAALKHTNQALLAAAAAAAAAAPSTALPQPQLPSSVPPTSGQAGSSVQAAYISTLEAQLSQTKQELSEQYKVQSLNAQRLFKLTDQVREFEQNETRDKQDVVKLKVEVESLRERQKWLKQTVDEKEKQIVILQDEIQSLELELDQLSIQNRNLKTDNAALLSRWLQAKNDEASRMNELFVAESSKLSAKTSGVVTTTTAAAASSEGANSLSSVATAGGGPSGERRTKSGTPTDKPTMSSMINSRTLASKPSRASISSTSTMTTTTTPRREATTAGRSGASSSGSTTSTSGSSSSIMRKTASQNSLMTTSQILDPRNKAKALAASGLMSRSTTSLASVRSDKGKARGQ
ncbi:hypothetical protein ACM66B_004573 [Microbotryomycetes sp. NB124-2]